MILAVRHLRAGDVVIRFGVEATVKAKAREKNTRVLRIDFDDSPPLRCVDEYEVDRVRRAPEGAAS